MEQYKTYKIEFKKSWNNSSNEIDNVTKFQEYEYKNKRILLPYNLMYLCTQLQSIHNYYDRRYKVLSI